MAGVSLGSNASSMVICGLNFRVLLKSPKRGRIYGGDGGIVRFVSIGGDGGSSGSGFSVLCQHDEIDICMCMQLIIYTGARDLYFMNNKKRTRLRALGTCLVLFQ